MNIQVDSRLYVALGVSVRSRPVHIFDWFYNLLLEDLLQNSSTQFYPNIDPNHSHSSIPIFIVFRASHCD